MEAFGTAGAGAGAIGEDMSNRSLIELVARGGDFVEIAGDGVDSNPPKSAKVLICVFAGGDAGLGGGAGLVSKNDPPLSAEGWRFCVGAGPIDVKPVVAGAFAGGDVVDANDNDPKASPRSPSAPGVDLCCGNVAGADENAPKGSLCAAGCGAGAAGFGVEAYSDKIEFLRSTRPVDGAPVVEDGRGGADCVPPKSSCLAGYQRLL